jgi:hypothetical protein
MKRVLLAVALASAGVTAAVAAPAGQISQTSIAGARLGLHQSDYKRLFGTPVRTDALRYPTNYKRLVFTKRKVAVIFPPNGKAIEIMTWNKADKTVKRIGTCSTITQLKAAYGGKLKPSEPNTVNGKVYAYTVGKLIFAATGRHPNPGPSKHVTAIALYSGPLNVAGFLALQFETSALTCS